MKRGSGNFELVKVGLFPVNGITHVSYTRQLIFVIGRFTVSMSRVGLSIHRNYRNRHIALKLRWSHSFGPTLSLFPLSVLAVDGKIVRVDNEEKVRVVEKHLQFALHRQLDCANYCRTLLAQQPPAEA